MSDNDVEKDVIPENSEEGVADIAADGDVTLDEAILSDSTKQRRPPWSRGKKRPAEPKTEAEAAEIQLKRIRQRLASTPRSEINAAMVLNEYRKGLNYDIVNQSGPIHCPIYTVRLTIDDQVFEGSGNSKKKAKLMVAEAALHALFGDVLPPPDVVATTSSDSPMKSQNPGVDSSSSDSGVQGMNPTIVLNRLRPGTSYDEMDPVVTEMATVTGGVMQSMSYCVSCVVDGVTFIGNGTSKKMAKASAAAETLEKVFGISCTRTSNGFPLFVGEMPAVAPKSKPGEPKAPSRPAVEMPPLLCSLPGEKNPVMLLHELYPDSGYTLSDVADDQGLFHATIPIEDRTFEGHNTSKKFARLSAAVTAVNYLHQTGYLNMRMAEKANNKKPKSWPKEKAQFSQDGKSQGRGGSFGQRGRGRGRGRGSYGALKSTYTPGNNKDASWISGGVLKAGDFLGINTAGSNGNNPFAADQDYNMYQSGYSTDDSFATANSSFGYGSASSPFGSFNKTPSTNQGFTAYGGVQSNTGSSLQGPLSKGGSGFARGGAGLSSRGGRGAATVGQSGTGPKQPSAAAFSGSSVKKLMDVKPSSYVQQGFGQPKPPPEPKNPAASTGFAVKTGAVGGTVAATQAQAGVASGGALAFPGYEYAYGNYGSAFVTGSADGLGYGQLAMAGADPNQAGAANYADYSQYYAQFDASAYAGYNVQQ